MGKFVDKENKQKKEQKFERETGQELEREQLRQMRKAYEKIPVPEEGRIRMEQAMERTRTEKRRMRRWKKMRQGILGAAAAFACVLLLANGNASVSMAMEKVPVLGVLVKAVTFREFQVEEEGHSADVEVPELTVQETQDGKADAKASNGVADINADIQSYTDAFIQEFESSLEEEGYEGLNISYEVVSDNDWLYSIKISALQTMASGAESVKYYHLDKTTGERLTLKDLFAADADYVTVISENIQQQMREQMAADGNLQYFIDDEDMPETNFSEIDAEQNFYINSDGKLVIAFSEYEAAPGYMGSPQFVIPTEVIEGLLNPVAKENIN